MAELDEALFPLSGLLDFRATLTRENGRDRLHIEIDAMECDAERMVFHARSALDAIPSVRAGCRKGLLRLSVAVWREENISSKCTGKRKINDQRHV
jgi:hypothetical protein